MTIETELPAVKVKELEWRPGYHDDLVTISQADTFGGLYQVRILSGVVWLDKPGSQTIYPSAEEAKSAAQADYEHRILSAIVVHPAEGGECQTLTAAARAFSEIFVVDNGDPTLSVEDIDMMELTHRYVDLHVALDAAKEGGK